jgi:hypothetical protein
MLPVSGALLGFLPYNFNPARIFLGDGGSTFLGFFLAAMGLVHTQKKATLLAIALPFVALGLPIADTLLSIFRRLIRGVPVFGGDRGHIHFTLLAMGLGPRRTVVVLYGVSLAFTSLALVSLFATRLTAAIAITGFCLLVFLGASILPEFQESVVRLGKGLMFASQQIRPRLALRDLRQEIRRASSAEQIEVYLGRVATLFGFHAFSLKLDGHTAKLLGCEQTLEWHQSVPSGESPQIPRAYWFITIPLNGPCSQTQEGSSLTLYRALAKGNAAPEIDSLVEALSSDLGYALQQISQRAIFTAHAATGESASELSPKFRQAAGKG